MGLQDLMGKEHQIEYAYNVSGRAAGSHGLGTTDLHAYKVSRIARISGVRNTRSNVHMRCQNGVA